MTNRVNGLYYQHVEPNEVVGGCIAIYENVWPKPIDTINQIEELCIEPNNCINWTHAKTIGSGAYQDVRRNLLMDLTYLSDITNDRTIQNTHNIFYNALLATTNSYAKTFNIHEYFYHEGYQLLKYRDGEEYKAHYDGGTGVGRAVSAICYLNSDYEGGEIEFVNFNIKIKPSSGMMILFPSNYAYTHIAHPVISGTKYALVTWIHDRPL
jgi:hypothetical protein